MRLERNTASELPGNCEPALRLRRSVRPAVVAIVLAALTAMRGFGQQERIVDAFDGLNFRIESTGLLQGAEHIEQRLGGAGTFAFTANVAGSIMVGAGGEIAIQSKGPGYAGLVFAFSAPIDARDFDYLEIRLRHSLSNSPLDIISFHTDDGGIVERRNLYQQPIGVTQTRIPVYELASWDAFIHPLDGLSQVSISFAFGFGSEGQTVFIESVSFGETKLKEAFAVTLEKVGGYQLRVSSDRVFGLDEICRLEASWDLNRWFELSPWTLGMGEVPLFMRTLSDEPFFRISRYNLVEQP